VKNMALKKRLENLLVTNVPFIYLWSEISTNSSIVGLLEYENEKVKIKDYPIGAVVHFGCSRNAEKFYVFEGTEVRWCGDPAISEVEMCFANENVLGFLRFKGWVDNWYPMLPSREHIFVPMNDGLPDFENTKPLLPSKPIIPTE
jgi:hypothetical protein